MRSLVVQLVALALVAVPASAVAVASSHRHLHTPAAGPKMVRTSPAVAHARGGRSTCAAYCQVRTLRRRLQSVHVRAVALARRVALPVPPPPKLSWRRAGLRKQLSHQAHVLGRYRIEARRPLRVRLQRFRAWLCIHQHEAAWNDHGDPYWGGLQMDRGFMRAYGGDMIRRHRGGLADTWTPAEQIVVAERAYRKRGFAPWPRTARTCGVL
jgi:hypothetical protein